MHYWWARFHNILFLHCECGLKVMGKILQYFGVKLVSPPPLECFISFLLCGFKKTKKRMLLRRVLFIGLLAL